MLAKNLNNELISKVYGKLGHKSDPSHNLECVQRIIALNALSSPSYLFVCKDGESNEYKCRLLHNLFIHSGASLTGDQEFDTFDALDGCINAIHKERHFARSAYHSVFSNIAPGRLQKLAYNNDLVLNFFFVKNHSQSFAFGDDNEKLKFSLNQKEDNPLLQIIRNRCKENDQSFSLDENHVFTLGTNNVTADFDTWYKLFQDLDYQDIEARLVKIQNKDAINKLCSKNDKSEKIENLEQKRQALLKIRDDIVLNEDFLKAFSGNKSVFKTQQYFRWIANEINILLEASENDFVNCKAWKARLDLLLDKAKINDLLLVYDLKLWGKGFSYKKDAINICTGEIKELFECTKNAIKRNENLLVLLRKTSVFKLFNCDSFDKEVQQRLIDIVKCADNFEDLDLERFLDILSNAVGIRVQKKDSISWKISINSFLKNNIPTLCFLCPSDFRYSKLDEENQFSRVSYLVRNAFGLTINKDWLSLDAHGAKKVHYQYRQNIGLVCFSERLSKAKKNLLLSLHLFVFSIFLATALIRVCEIICKKLKLLQNNKKVAQIFLYSAVVFNFLLVLFVVDFIIGTAAEKILDAVIFSAKCVDQYLFGCFFSRIFGFVRLCLQKFYTSLFRFVSVLFDNLTEYGFLDGIKVTFSDLHLLHSIKSLPVHAFDFYDDFLTKYSEAEIRQLPQTWRFNIFDPFSCAKKIYDISRADTKFGYHNLLCQLIIQNLELKSKKFNSSCAPILHKGFLRSILSEDLECLSIKFDAVFKKAKASLNPDGNNNPKDLSDEQKDFFSGQIFERCKSFDGKIDLKLLLIEAVAIDAARSAAKIDLVDLSKIEQQKKAIEYALSAFNALEIEKIVHKNERLFSLTKIHKRVKNSLEVFDQILISRSQNTDYVLDLFHDFFSEAYFLLKEVYHASCQPMPNQLAEFAQVFSISELSHYKNYDVKRISSYIKAHNGNVSFTDWYKDRAFGIIENIVDPYCIVCVPTCFLLQKLGLSRFFIEVDLKGVLGGASGRDILLQKHELVSILLDAADYTTCVQEQEGIYKDIFKLITGEHHSIASGKYKDRVESIISGACKLKSSGPGYRMQEFLNFLSWVVCSIFFVDTIKSALYTEHKHDDTFQVFDVGGACEFATDAVSIA